MMENDNFLFNKHLQMVAIVIKQLQFFISLIFEFICCQSSDSESTESTTGHSQGILCQNALRWRALIFFFNQTVDNRATLYTYSFDPMLFQICLTTATLTKFTQNSNLNKSVQEILTLESTESATDHNQGIFEKPC